MNPLLRIGIVSSGWIIILPLLYIPWKSKVCEHGIPLGRDGSATLRRIKTKRSISPLLGDFTNLSPGQPAQSCAWPPLQTQEKGAQVAGTRPMTRASTSLHSMMKWFLDRIHKLLEISAIFLATFSRPHQCVSNEDSYSGYLQYCSWWIQSSGCLFLRIFIWLYVCNKNQNKLLSLHIYIFCNNNLAYRRMIFVV